MTDAVTESQDSNASAIEAKARSMGWTDKDSFRGDPDKWVDAETFAKRGEEVLPIVRANLRKTETELQKAREQLESQAKTMEDFKSFMESARKRDKEEFDRQIVALKTAKSEAIKDGDGERVLQIEDAIEAVKAKQVEVKPEPKAESKPEVNQPDPVFVEWVGENPWYGTNAAMTRIADGLAEDLREENPGLKGKAFLDMVKERFKARFPEKFGGARSQVDNGSGASVAKGKKTYENLPADAKKQCDEFVRMKILTRDQYVADFEW